MTYNYSISSLFTSLLLVAYVSLSPLPFSCCHHPPMSVLARPCHPCPLHVFFISYPISIPITAWAFIPALLALLQWLIVVSLLLFYFFSFYSLSISSGIDCVPILGSNSIVKEMKVVTSMWLGSQPNAKAHVQIVWTKRMGEEHGRRVWTKTSLSHEDRKLPGCPAAGVSDNG